MVRFFLWFLLLQATLFGLELTPWVQEWFVVPWTNTLAAMSAGLVKLFDPSVLATGKVLQSASNGFAVSIEAGCNGVEATIVLVAANTMAMSIRERTGEIAILKTLGFTSRDVLGVLIAESALIALAGGLLGSLGARYLLGAVDFQTYTAGFIQAFDVKWETIMLAAAISLAVAFGSTLVPAWNASRLQIADAVRIRCVTAAHIVIFLVLSLLLVPGIELYGSNLFSQRDLVTIGQIEVGTVLG